MAKKIVEGLWDCRFCDTKGIRGSIRECPGCGKPRGDNVKFYLPSDYRTRAGVNLTEEEKLPDWQCEYCGSYNKGTDLKCTRCEAPKEGKNYFELHKEVKESTYSANHVNTNWKCHYCGAENPRETTVCKNCGAEKGSKKQSQAKKAPENKKPWILRHPVLLGVAAVFLFIFIWFLLDTKKHDFVAESFRWETTVEVEEYKTVRESDWSVPPGGRVVYTRQEIHHYTKNTDSNETVTQETSYTAENHSGLEKTNPTAYEKSHNPFLYRVYADDLGNGYFEVDDGGGSYDGGDSKPSEPVYRTKYYYDIERWVVTRKETASAEDQQPYEPEVILGDNERKGDVKTIYSVYASKDGKDPKYFYLSEEDFFALSPGQSFQASGLGSQITVRR